MDGADAIEVTTIGRGSQCLKKVRLWICLHSTITVAYQFNMTTQSWRLIATTRCKVTANIASFKTIWRIHFSLSALLMNQTHAQVTNINISIRPVGREGSLGWTPRKGTIKFTGSVFGKFAGCNTTPAWQSRPYRPYCVFCVRLIVI